MICLRTKVLGKSIKKLWEKRKELNKLEDITSD